MRNKKRIILLIVLIIMLVIVFCVYFFVKKPVFAEINIEASFSPQEPKAGDSVSLAATISNNGEKKAENILVQFFYDDPAKGNKIDEQIIDLIKPGQSQEISIDWKGSFGTHKIYIMVDYQDQTIKTVLGIVVGLAVIESKELSEKEFLENSSIKALNEIAQDKGYSQIVLANHSNYSEGAESKSGVLFSEKDQKISYLVQFQDQEFSFYQNPILIEMEGENIILTSEQGEVILKDGEVSTDLEDDYGSCSYGHCVFACSLYFIIEDDIWSEVVDKTCDACKEAVKMGAEPEAVATACTACVASLGGAVGGCAWTCSLENKISGDPCWQCVLDICGPTEDCRDPHCEEKDFVYEWCDSYYCENPLSLESYCRSTTKQVYKQYCGDDIYPNWLWYCDGEKVFKKMNAMEKYCDKGQCVEEKKTIQEPVEDCSLLTCPYSKYQNKTAKCSEGLCQCCLDNSHCQDKELYKTENICYDQGSIGEKQYFHNYICKTERGCELDPEPLVEKIRTESCGQDYIDYGEWKCKDEKIKERTRTLHNYYCQNVECGGKTESMLAEKVTCSDRCLDGECMGTECTKDDDCPEDTMEWGSWECKSDGKTLERKTYWWNNSYCSSDYKCLLDTTKSKIETQICDQRCYINECVECLSDNDCSSGVCFNNQCTGCVNNNDCEYLEYEEYETSCDANYLLTDTIKYKFYCQDNECVEQSGVIEDEPERYLCPTKTCSNGQCVDCANDSDCDSAYTQWENWYCENDSIRKRDKWRYSYQCLDSMCIVDSELTGESESHDCMLDERCETGTCVKEYGLIVGADGLAIKYIGPGNYSILSSPSGFGNLYDVDFYSGGALIAGDVASNGKILRYDGQDSNLIEVPLFPEGNYTGIEFKPGGLSYALIVGDKIVEWAGNFNIIAANNYSGNDISWKPDGSYALIIEDAQVIKFISSPNQISSLYIPFDLLYNVPGFDGVDWLDAYIPLTELSWKLDGNEAFIISDIGLVLKYNGSSFNIDYDPNDVLYEVNFQGIDFKPDGSYALIVGSEGLIKKYDGTSFTNVPADSSIDFQGVAWISNDQALIVGTRWTGSTPEGIALLYNASTGSLSTAISNVPGVFIGVNW